jgi:hypothetical protein
MRAFAHAQSTRSFLSSPSRRGKARLDRESNHDDRSTAARNVLKVFFSESKKGYLSKKVTHQPEQKQKNSASDPRIERKGKPSRVM